jgi:hypothetical protein
MSRTMNNATPNTNAPVVKASGSAAAAISIAAIAAMTMLWCSTRTVSNVFVNQV